MIKYAFKTIVIVSLRSVSMLTCDAMNLLGKFIIDGILYLKV